MYKNALGCCNKVPMLCLAEAVESLPQGEDGPAAARLHVERRCRVHSALLRPLQPHLGHSAVTVTASRTVEAIFS